jgi:hypothetical protein
MLFIRGYSRKDIVLLFEELEKKGYGTFNRGSRGRARMGFFEFKESIEEYTLTIIKKKVGRPKKKITKDNNEN